MGEPVCRDFSLVTDYWVTATPTEGKALGQVALLAVNAQASDGKNTERPWSWGTSSNSVSTGPSLPTPGYALPSRLTAGLRGALGWARCGQEGHQEEDRGRKEPGVSGPGNREREGVGMEVGVAHETLNTKALGLSKGGRWSGLGSR